MRFLDVAAEASGQHLNYSKMASDSEINKEKIRRFTQILLDTLLIHRIESFDAVSSNRKARQKDRFLFFDNGVRNGILKKHRNQFTPTELGPLFESWIIQQVIAFSSYHRKNWSIKSYRDDQNLEVDLILETEKRLIAIEIKFQSKFRPDFSDNLLEFEKIARSKVVEKIVVYTGANSQQTNQQIKIMSYQDFLRSLDRI